MNEFLVTSLAALLFASVAAGIVGALVVVRRSTYVAGAVSHSVLAGLGLSLLLSTRFGIDFLPPYAGALLSSLAVALVLANTSMKRGGRTDAVLSAVWTGGIALGMVFVSLTPDYQSDLMSYLFGSVLFVSPKDLLVMGVLDVVVVAATLIGFNRFLAIAFDAELAALRGVNVKRWEYLFYILTALTVVLLVSVAGVVLAVAFLALPATAAGLVSRRLNLQMLIATAFAFIASLAGLGASWFFDMPVSASIVLSLLLILGLCKLFARS